MTVLRWLALCALVTWPIWDLVGFRYIATDRDVDDWVAWVLDEEPPAR